MSEIFQGRCPFCGHLFKIKLTYELTDNVNVKSTCPKCKKKSATIDESGYKIQIIPVENIQSPNKQSSSNSNLHTNDTSYAEASKKWGEEEVSRKTNSTAIEQSDDSIFLSLVEFVLTLISFPFEMLFSLIGLPDDFLDDSLALETNSSFIGLWVSFIVGASNSQNGFYDPLFDLFSHFTDGISEFISIIVTVFIFMLPGFFLLGYGDSIEGNLKYTYKAALNSVSLGLVLFIIFSFIGDYSTVKERENLKISQHKAKVLFALQDKNCNLADKYYQSYKLLTDSEHISLSLHIQNCLDN